MERLPLVRGEREVTFDHQALGDRRIARETELCRHRAFVHLTVARERSLLAVQRDPFAGHSAVLECAPHQPGRCNRDAVVAEADRARGGELAHLGQLGPGLAFRDRRQESDGNLGLGARGFDQRTESCCGVDDRVGVGHREDRAVAARRGGGRAGGNRLLVLPPGCAQVHVRVDERRREHQTLGLDDAVRVRVEVLTERRDHAVVHTHVEHCIYTRGQVDDTRAAHDDVLLGSVLGKQHHATSSTDWVLTSIGPFVSRS